MKTYADASADWRDNISLASFDGAGGILNAMAAATYKAGEKAPVNKQFRGPPAAGRTTKFVTDEFMKVFVAQALPDGDQVRMLQAWNTGGVPGVTHTAAWYYGQHVAIYFSAYNNHCDLTVIAGVGHPAFGMAEEFAKKFIDKRQVGSVYMLMSDGNGGVTFSDVGRAGVKLERGNYTPKVLEAYDRIKDEVRVKNPHGRLSILSGPPGCGKTFIIKGLLHEVPESVFVIVSQEALPGLLGPAGLAAMIDLRSQHSVPIVLILEDSDDALAPRENGNTSVLAALLNLGDGIVGGVLDVRLLATTNRDHQEFDPAILRPGRLSTHCDVRELSVEVANARLKQLAPEATELEKPVTLAEVYQRARDAGWKATRIKATKKVGF